MTSAAEATARGESLPLHALFDEPLGFRASAVVSGDRMALAEQTIHHLAAHDSQPNEAKIGHETLLIYFT